MMIKLHKLDIKEIADLQIANDDFLKIESTGVEPDKLRLLNEILKKEDIPITVSIDMREQSTAEKIKGTDVFKYLSNAKKLSLNAVLTIPVESISFLESIEHLKHLSLDGFFVKNLDISLLKKFKELAFFELNNGLSKKQHTLIADDTYLNELRVSELNLLLMKEQEHLRSLRIYNKLQNGEELSMKVPQLEHVYLEKCKDLDLAKCISTIPKLKSVWLRYISNTTVIPEFINSSGIRIFQTTKLPKLENIESIFECSNLEALMMTELEHLRFEDFKKLATLKKLKVAYVTFKNESENKKFRAFSEDYNLVYTQPALYDEKYNV